MDRRTFFGRLLGSAAALLGVGVAKPVEAAPALQLWPPPEPGCGWARWHMAKTSISMATLTVDGGCLSWRGEETLTYLWYGDPDVALSGVHRELNGLGVPRGWEVVLTRVSHAGPGRIRALRVFRKRAVETVTTRPGG